MVKVLPEPVCPYAKMVALNPFKTSETLSIKVKRNKEKHWVSFKGIDKEIQINQKVAGK